MYYKIQLLSIIGYFILFSYIYSSFIPFILIFSSYLLTRNILLILFKNKVFTSCYSYMYHMFTFISSISAFYREVLMDPHQVSSDAYNFFIFSKDFHLLKDLGIEISLYTSGIGAIYIWSLLYNMFDFFNLELFPYMGIIINVVFVSISGIILLKTIGIYSEIKKENFYRYTLFFTSIGVICLFASLHLRDCFILLVNTLLLYSSILYLSKNKIRYLLLFILFCIFAFFGLALLRVQFVFIPLLLFVSAYIYKKCFINSFIKKHILLSIVIISFSSFVILYFFSTDFLYTLERQTYVSNISSLNSSSTNSIAYNLIVDTPPYIRIFSGFVYLFAFPVPFWTGINTNSFYYLLKSINVFSSYIIFSGFITSIYVSYKKLSINYKIYRYILIVSFAFTSGIVLTSLEVRHLGTFLPFYLFLLFCLPLDLKIVKNFFFNVIKIFLSFIIILHFLRILKDFI